MAKQVMDHVKRLSVDIGHRPAGSPGNEAAAEYIEQVFRQAGLAVKKQVFSCSSWDHTETVLELAGQKLDAAANWRSLPCEVTGGIVPAGTLEELAQANMKGRIALLHGELTQDEFMNRASTVYYPERHRKTNDLLDRKLPAAVITVNPLLNSLRHVIKDPDMGIPSATVSPEIGCKLMHHAGKPVRLHIAATRFPGRSWNVLGTGSGSRSGRIILCAHYDTVWGSPGAFDNASGIGVMLTLAGVLAGRKLSLGLEFVAFSAEEFGGQGTEAYVVPYGLKQVPFQWDRPVGEQSEVWQPVLAAINADGVGLALGANSITTIAGSMAFDDLVNAIRSEKYPGVVRVDPWPASDHYTFYSHGVPSIALGCTGGITNINHQPIDTIKWISPAKLAEVVSLAADVVEALQDKTSEWTRSKIIST